MTEILEYFAAGRIRSRDPRRKRRGTGRLSVSLSLVFVIAAYFCAGCDDDARTSREKEAAAIEDVIRQVNEINRDFSTEQPKFGEEDAYKEKVEKCYTDLKQIDISPCPLRFQHFFKQYVQAVDGLSGLLGIETREKRGFDARCEKRAEQLSLINKAKDNVNFIALDYGVMAQIGESEPEAEGGEPSSNAEKATSSADGGSRKNLIPGDFPKEIQESVDSIVMQAVNRLEIDKLATKEDVRAAQTLPWIIGGVLLLPVTVCLVLLVLICLRGGTMFSGTQQYADAQTGAAVTDRNDLLLELAELCYRHGEYSECVRHLENARRLGVRDAKNMYSRYLDDSKEFRAAAEVYQFLEKHPRQS